MSAENNPANNLQQRLRTLERRDWWLWWTAMAVMLFLTLAIVSFSLAPHLRVPESRFLFGFQASVRGLAALVVVFDIYVVYQQILIKRLRHHLAAQTEATAKMTIAAEEFRHLSLIDPLTGLYNRRHVEERLSAEVARSTRHGCPLTVLVIDLNDFKQINDSNGHSAGDVVLKEFSALLRNAIRPSDVAARIGGDEFVVLLPECDCGKVAAVVSRLRPLEVQHGEIRVSYGFSAGWADMRAGEKPAALLERADHDLYKQKQARKTGQYDGAAMA